MVEQIAGFIQFLQWNPTEVNTPAIVGGGKAMQLVCDVSIRNHHERTGNLFWVRAVHR